MRALAGPMLGVLLAACAEPPAPQGPPAPPPKAPCDDPSAVIAHEHFLVCETGHELTEGNYGIAMTTIFVEDLGRARVALRLPTAATTFDSPGAVPHAAQPHFALRVEVTRDAEHATVELREANPGDCASARRTLPDGKDDVAWSHAVKTTCDARGRYVVDRAGTVQRPKR